MRAFQLVGDDRHSKQLAKVLRHGETSHAKSHTAAFRLNPKRDLLTFEGPIRVQMPALSDVLLTFEGPQYRTRGSIWFKHWDTDVLAIDFDRQLVTDFGYGDYSITTRNNISGWMDAIRDGFGFSREELPYDWYRWTTCWRAPRGTRHRNRGTPKRDEDPLFDLFRMHAPWVVRNMDRTGWHHWWFHWPSYDRSLAEQYHESRRFLRDNQNWRYFTFEWKWCPITQRHRWERRFISDGAMRLWRQREKRNGRPCPPI